MNIMIYSWNSHADHILYNKLIQMQHKVLLFSHPLSDYDMDSEFAVEFMKHMIETDCELVFTYNFFPVISNICNVKQIKYIAWVFDCPHSTLLSESVFHPTNRIFVFDRTLADEVRAYGVPHVWHMPLGVDVDFFRRIIHGSTDEEKKLYRSEVSFMGGLYTGDYNFYDQIQYLPEYIKGYLEGVMGAQRNIYGYNFVKEMLTEEILSEIRKYIKIEFGKSYFVPYENILASMINKKITVTERESILKKISKEVRLDLYTGSDSKGIPDACNKGFIDYMNTMPKVFSGSRINLNITLRSITSGIPLRVLDVLGCGGFLLTNYQPEIAEHFKDGEELVMYGSEEEITEKVRFYLDHEDVRKEIACKGHEKVARDFSLEKQLDQIFRLAL